MPHTVPACPQCSLENTYPDGAQYVCPDCGFEWPAQPNNADADEAASDGVVRDANGNALADGDALTSSLAMNGGDSLYRTAMPDRISLR